MKRKSFYISLIAAGLMSASCQEVDPLAGTELGTIGITSVKAAFTGEEYEKDQDANFSAQPDENDNIVIEIPWFYPKSSDNVVTEAHLECMRVTATLASGTYIEPGLGVMNMNEVHYITAHDAAGRTKDYVLKAEIIKLRDCEMNEFKVTSAGTEYQGIINPGQKTISLMVTEDELTDCTVSYTASPHSTVEGNLQTIKSGDKVTVIAHNGVDKNEYTINFAMPEKIAYGARLNSQKNLWTKYFTIHYPGVTITNSPIRLASKGDYLYMLTGDKIYNFNRKNGEFVGTVNIPGGYSATSMMNDEAGNIVFAADGTSEFKVYYIDSFEGGSEPVELISYSNGIGASKIGNIRVAGNVKEKAVVTATAAGIAASSLVWAIEGGVAGQPTSTTGIPGAGTLWVGYNGSFAPVSSDVSDGVLAFGYWGTYDLYHSSDLKSYSMVYDPNPQTGNENTNCVTTASFNKARYCAIGLGSHFSYGAVPYFSVIDASTPSAMAGALLYTVPYDELKFSGFKGTGATSDVLIVPSEDGYYMDVYFVDGNYDVLTCYEFDCIQQ